LSLGVPVATSARQSPLGERSAASVGAWRGGGERQRSGGQEERSDISVGSPSPTPRSPKLLQGSLSAGAPAASFLGIGAGLARTRRAGFGEAGVDAFGLTLRFDSPARVRSSIVASGASFLMERIPAMADAL